MDKAKNEEIVVIPIRIFLTYIKFISFHKQQILKVAPYMLLPPNHHRQNIIDNQIDVKPNYLK